MKWTVEGRAILSGCVVLALLLIIGFAQYGTVRELSNNLQWVTHTVEVGKQLGTVEDALSKSATAARRFAISGDTDVLSSYHASVENLRASLQGLAEMVADNAAEKTRVASLGPLLERRISTLGGVIAARQGGGSAAAAVAELDRTGLPQMDPIREILDEMRAEEDQLLVERSARAAASRKRANAFVALGSLFAVAVVVWGVVALHRDIVKRNRVEAALRSSEAALRDLSGRLLQAQDEERRRLARELHDGTSQLLAAVQLRLAALQTTISPDNAQIQHSLTELSSVVERCSREIRTLSHLLHPPLLEHTGIGSAIRWYAEGFSERSGVKVQIQIPDNWPRFSSEVETAIFRITQEALTNIHRHSGSATAKIEANLENGRIRLEISDDGRGITPDILETPARFGVGLRGMTERVRLLGGKLTIESGKLGTTVRAELPVEGSEAASG